MTVHYNALTVEGQRMNTEEPQNLEQYILRFQDNQRIVGLGTDVQMHMPCPFCAAPNFMIYQLHQTYSAVAKEHTCRQCHRSMTGVVTESESGHEKHMSFFQTGGPDQPEWLVPQMPRAHKDPVVPPVPHERVTCHDGDPQAERFAPLSYHLCKNDSYKSCSYCGSAHPRDVLAVLEAGGVIEFADMKYGWPHKLYVHPGDHNPKKLNKFYTVHLQDARPEERQRLEYFFGVRFEFEGNSVRCFKL